jgi:uncharacterized membrane protein YcgQ (UPF0703/DUF1980 family)
VNTSKKIQKIVINSTALSTLLCRFSLQSYFFYFSKKKQGIDIKSYFILGMVFAFMSFATKKLQLVIDINEIHKKHTNHKKDHKRKKHKIRKFT